MSIVPLHLPAVLRRRTCAHTAVRLTELRSQHSDYWRCLSSAASDRALPRRFGSRGTLSSTRRAHSEIRKDARVSQPQRDQESRSCTATSQSLVARERSTSKTALSHAYAYLVCVFGRYRDSAQTRPANASPGHARHRPSVTTHTTCTSSGLVGSP